MRSERRSQGEAGSEAGALDRRPYDALTDLSAYALTLEAEGHHLDDRLLELAEIESSVAERRALLRERDQLAEDLSALRETIAALQEQFGRERRCVADARPDRPR